MSETTAKPMTPQEDLQAMKEAMVNNLLSERHALCIRLAAIDKNLSALGKPIKAKEKQKV